MWESLECVFEFGAQESPGASEFAAGEDSSTCVFLDGVGLELKERGYVVDGHDVFPCDAH